MRTSLKSHYGSRTGMLEQNYLILGLPVLLLFGDVYFRYRGGECFQYLDETP